MSAENLTWEQIKERYSEQWVELIDYDWPDGVPWPKSGVVRVHSPERKEFWRLVKEKQPEVTDSAIVYAGPVDRPGIVRNNLCGVRYTHRFEPAKWHDISQVAR
jgi:hypothetical protein